MRRKLLLPVILLVIAAGGYYVVSARASSLVLTGIVTTNDVIVSAQIPGQLGQLLVKEGDTVAAGQVLAVITPDELRA
jgi:HlyD family secretion protein